MSWLEEITGDDALYREQETNKTTKGSKENTQDDVEKSLHVHFPLCIWVFGMINRKSADGWLIFPIFISMWIVVQTGLKCNQ